MNHRHRTLLVLAAAALLLCAVGAAAKDYEKSKVMTYGEDGKSYKVEVQEKNGDRHVKVFEIVDGDDVLVKELHGDDHAIELDDGEVIMLKTDGDHIAWIDGAEHDFDIHEFVGSGSRAWLGIHMEDLGEQLAEYFGGDGVLIKEVVEDSPAAEAGLKAGDVVTRIGDDDVEDGADIVKAMRDREPGDEVEVKVRRKGKDKRFDVTLAEREFDAHANAFYFDKDGGHDFTVLRGLHDTPQLKKRMRMHRFPGGGQDEEIENLKADIAELKAMIQELKDR